MVISNIKHEFFNLDFLLFQTKKFITSWLKRGKEKDKNNELISRLKYASKISPLKRFHGCFFDPVKKRTVCSALNNPWKMESFCWTKNPS